MGQKVYLVTAGEYSDYRICGAFSSRDFAADYIGLCKSEDSGRGWGGQRYEIEEWALDPGVSERREGYQGYAVAMRESGELFNIHECLNVDQPAIVVSRRLPENIWIPVVYCETWARNKDHAVKIVNEKRAQLIASGEWDRRVKQMPILNRP